MQYGTPRYDTHFTSRLKDPVLHSDTESMFVHITLIFVLGGNETGLKCIRSIIWDIVQRYIKLHIDQVCF